MLLDVLTQVSAATKSLEAVALGLLDEHLEHCVAQAVADGGQIADGATLRPAVREPTPAGPALIPG